MAINEREKDDVTFEIKEKLGVLNSYPTGWHKELNLVSWNGNPAKYDIRDWDPTHERMSRGITLHPAEAKKLYDLLREKQFGGKYNNRQRHTEHSPQSDQIDQTDFPEPVQVDFSEAEMPDSSCFSEPEPDVEEAQAL